MKRFMLAAAAVLALAGCGTSQAAVHKPATLTVKGSFTVYDTCAGMHGDGYGDIVTGQQVAVTSPAGQQLGVGPLEGGTPGSETTCVFSFTVSHVPARFAEYGIKLGNRGTVDYSRSELNQPVLLEVGSS